MNKKKWQNCFALVDVNNFYVSCERIFNPKLWAKPVLVLSNNDGCTIARSNECKALGIPMGEPLFKIKRLVKKHDISVFSSNYALYGDISARIISILQDLAPEVIVYSIDESFLDLSSLQQHYNIEKFCTNIVKKIYRYTGVPVSIGIGPTKTLAKIANHVVKKKRLSSHVLHLTDEAQINIILRELSIDKIWGIGTRWAKSLNQLGYFNALDLKHADTTYIRKQFNSVLASTVNELNNQSCINIDAINVHKKEIVVSRSFGTRQTQLQPIQEALANYVTRAAEKLRQQASVASGLAVFLQTNMLNQREAKYRNSIYLQLEYPTADTRLFLHYATKGLKRIFISGYRYKKVGVMLSPTHPESSLQLDIFKHGQLKQSEKLMTTIDTINTQLGKNSIQFASQGIKKSWQMQRNYLSGLNVTNWQQLPTVNCD